MVSFFTLPPLCITAANSARQGNGLRRDKTDSPNHFSPCFVHLLNEILNSRARL